MEEKVILVDENDAVLGEMEKMEAHKKGVLHRAVSVFVFNSKQQLLLQKRASTKYHSPGLWTNTACTHPRLNENNSDAVRRRLIEEMGLQIEKVTKIFDFTYKETLDKQLIEHEFDHVFIAFSDATPRPDPVEISDYRSVDMPQVLKLLASSPHEYTVWFKKIMERVSEHMNTFFQVDK